MNSPPFQNLNFQSQINILQLGMDNREGRVNNNRTRTAAAVAAAPAAVVTGGKQKASAAACTNYL